MVNGRVGDVTLYLRGGGGSSGVWGTSFGELVPRMYPAILAYSLPGRCNARTFAVSGLHSNLGPATPQTAVGPTHACGLLVLP